LKNQNQNKNKIDLLEQSPNCNVKYCIHVEAGWFGDKADEVFWEQKLANTIVQFY